MRLLVSEDKKEVSVTELMEYEHWHVIAFRDDDDVYTLVGVNVNHKTYWAFHPLYCDGLVMYQGTNVEETVRLAMANNDVLVFDSRLEFGEWVMNGELE